VVAQIWVLETLVTVQDVSLGLETWMSLFYQTLAKPTLTPNLIILYTTPETDYKTNNDKTNDDGVGISNCFGIRSILAT
jgi:uncharacterized protein (DUF169 family)